MVSASSKNMICYEVYGRWHAVMEGSITTRSTLCDALPTCFISLIASSFAPNIKCWLLQDECDQLLRAVDAVGERLFYIGGLRRPGDQQRIGGHLPGPLFSFNYLGKSLID